MERIRTARGPGRRGDAGPARRSPPPRLSRRRTRDLVPAAGRSADLPDDFVAAIERWQTRSGTVKINLALDRLPVFTCKPGFDPEVHGGTIVLAESARRHRGRVPGRGRRASPSGCPSRTSAFRGCSTARSPRRAARDVDVHAVGAARVGRRARPGRARGVRRPGDRSRGGARARVQELDPAPQVIGPDEMENEYGLVGGNIFHGELSAGPALPRPARARLRGPADAVAGLFQASSATHGGGGVTGIPGRTWSGRSSPTAGRTGYCSGPGPADLAAAAALTRAAAGAYLGRVIRPRRFSRPAVRLAAPRSVSGGRVAAPRTRPDGVLPREHAGDRGRAARSPSICIYDTRGRSGGQQGEVHLTGKNVIFSRIGRSC